MATRTLQDPDSITSSLKRFIADPDNPVVARLEMLRKGLLACVVSMVLAFAICLYYSNYIFDFLMGPLRAALPPGASLVATRVPEVFLLYLEMSFFAAVFVSAPVWLGLGAGFIARSLGKRQKTTFLAILALGTILFLLGAAFGHYVLFPYGARFLTTFGSGTVHVLLSVGDVFSFYAQFVLGLGAVFQIPTVVLILSMWHLVTPGFLIRHLKHVVVIVFIIAAIVTPTPDMVTQTILALPMMGLYFFSIFLSWLVQRKPRS